MIPVEIAKLFHQYYGEELREVGIHTEVRWEYLEEADRIALIAAFTRLVEEGRIVAI